MQLYRIGKTVFAFMKFQDSTTSRKIIIPELYRPKRKIAFVLHSTKNIDTATIFIDSNGLVVRDSSNYSSLFIGFCSWETN